MTDDEILCWHEQLEEATTNTDTPEQGIITHVRELLRKEAGKALLHEAKLWDFEYPRSGAIHGIGWAKERIRDLERMVKERQR